MGIVYYLLITGYIPYCKRSIVIETSVTCDFWCRLRVRFCSEFDEQ